MTREKKTGGDGTRWDKRSQAHRETGPKKIRGTKIRGGSVGGKKTRGVKTRGDKTSVDNIFHQRRCDSKRRQDKGRGQKVTGLEKRRHEVTGREGTREARHKRRQD